MKPEGRIQAPLESAASIATDRNVMPSMVVRQQRIHQLGAASANQNLVSTARNSGTGAATAGATSAPQLRNYQDPHLDPSHDASLSAPTVSLIKAAKELSSSLQSQSQPQQQQQQQQQQACLFDQDGLVLPKRVLHHNPIAAEAQPIIRDLNRELKFNQIRGKNVLDQKSELKKALEKLEENKRRKEAEQERLSRRTSLELRLEERAERLAKETSSGNGNSHRQLPLNKTIGETTNNLAGGSSAASASSAASSAAASVASATMNSNATPLSNFSIKPITR